MSTTTATPTTGTRVQIVAQPWIHAHPREFIGRITAIDALGRIRIHTSPGWFHPEFTTITPAPSRRDGDPNPLEGLADVIDIATRQARDLIPPPPRAATAHVNTRSTGL